MAWVISCFIRCLSKPLTDFGFERGIGLISRFSQMICTVISSIKAYPVAPVSTRALIAFLLLSLNRIQDVIRGSGANGSSAILKEDEINNRPSTMTLMEVTHFLTTQSCQVPESVPGLRLELLSCSDR